MRAFLSTRSPGIRSDGRNAHVRVPVCSAQPTHRHRPKVSLVDKKKKPLNWKMGSRALRVDAVEVGLLL
jgi:hypothetical protein